jgi:hypothetical protein
VTDMLDGVALAPGSVILVGSVSDLAKQGVSGYTEEVARTVRILKEKLGPNVQVGILPPILLGGVNSFNLLRGIVEVETWVERLEGGEGALLQKTRGGGDQEDVGGRSRQEEVRGGEATHCSQGSGGI